MTTVTIVEYNVLFRNPRKVILGDVLDLMDIGSVMGLNEGARGEPAQAIREACAKRKWQFVTTGESDWLLWNPNFWSPRGAAHTHKICQSAQELGTTIKLHPARYMVSQALRHQDGSVHDFNVTHLPQGFAKPEGSFSDKIEWLVDVQAKEATLRVHNITERRIKANKAKFHHLMGDMNVRQANTQQPWYPANLWDDLWVSDTLPGSIDWMMISKVSLKNGMRVVDRDTYDHGDGMNSDHKANSQKVRW